MTIAAVVLAAGASRRLGRPKQTLMLGGETLVERALRVAMEAGLSPAIVVLRDDSLIERMREMGAQAVVNGQSNEGMASSIRAGVLAAKELGCSGVVLMTCDQVEMRAEHLRALCAVAERVAGSRYAGRNGIPAYFPAASFAELLALEGDVGARGLLMDAASVEDERLAVDIDTEADMRAAGL